ncbi:unnamed protein product [Closterium sp. NIES-64]|nr:unnamed protein product [Closterium sp. NIES-64]
MDGKGPVVPDGDGSWEHTASWPNIPATATGGTAEGAGGRTSGGSRAASLSAYITPRVQEQELRFALVELFTDGDLPFCLVDRPSLREQLDGLRLTDVHWEALVELKEFLEPFNTITKAAEGSLYPTAASVVPLYNQLLDKLEISSRKEGVTPLRQALDSATLAKLKKFKYGEKEELVIATFLDPHYKIVFFQLPKWEARNAAHVTKVGGCARRVQDVDEETVIWLVHVRLAKY